MKDILDRNVNDSIEKLKRQIGGYSIIAKVTGTSNKEAAMGQAEGDGFKRQVAAHVTDC